MRNHTTLMASAVILGLSRATPIFGHGADMVEKGRIEREQKRKRRKVRRAANRSGHAPHQGKQEIARRLARGFGQYPEYTALRARNIASGKWPETTTA